MEKKFVVAGIDYSMTSPAVVVHTGDTWSKDNCVFHYLVKRDKHLVVTDQLKGSLYKDFTHQQERFRNLAEWSVDILNENSVDITGLEGYSYGSTSSRLFEMGENTGLLKYKLWDAGRKFNIYPPTMIKKFATGKGNVNKLAMWEAFKEETSFPFFNILGQEEGKHWSPISDMVDAYYIAKYAFEQTKKIDII